MNHEQRILDIEEERLELEKRRDRHASFRFIFGSVLLVLATTGASLYLNAKQESRSLVNSERQWVVPMLMTSTEEDHQSYLKIIDSLLELGLSDQTNRYLRAERRATIEEQKKIAKKKKAELEAKRIAEQKAREAAEAKQKEEEAERVLEAKRLAQEEAERQEAEAAAARAKAKREAADKAAQEAAANVAREAAERQALIQQQIEDKIRRFNVY